MAARITPPALHLHLDVADGVRADALLGALVSVGAAPAAADAALTALFGPGAALTVERVRAWGVWTQRAQVQLSGVEAHPAGPTRPLPERRRRPRTFARDQRPAPALTPAAEAAAPLPGTPADAARARARARGARASRAPALLERLRDVTVRPVELVIALRHSALEPVSKALALRAAAALVEGLGRLGLDANEPILDGSFAARALAQLTAAAALVDALSPAVVSASVVGVSSRASEPDGLMHTLARAPSPWLMSVLEGAWVAEREECAASDVVGAALVRTLASRFGARGLFLPTAQGFGVAPMGASASPLIVRASIGHAAPIGSRAGESRAEVWVNVRASMELSVDREALRAALTECGARDLTAREVTNLRGQALLDVDLLVGARELERAMRALWSAGATSARTTWVEARTPAADEMTVRVGRGTKSASVRVRVVRGEDGAVLSVQCVSDDVREAARATRRPEEVVRAEALAAWSARGGEVIAGEIEDDHE